MKDSMQSMLLEVDLGIGCRECNTSTTTINFVWLFYNSLFGSEISMKEKNKILILKFQDFIRQDHADLINNILSDSALADLHPSLIKSALIMTSGIAEKLPARQKAADILAKKMSA